MKAGGIDLLEGGSVARITWPDGTSARFHALWLRDNALDPKTRSAGNGQRLITVLDVPAATTIASAELNTDSDIHVALSGDGHEADFPSGWLRARIYDRDHTTPRGWVSDEIELWDRRLQASVPSASLTVVREEPNAFCKWLAAVRRFGFAVLTDVPRTPGRARVREFSYA